MDMESNIRGVWLSSKNNDIFSKGTDFKRINLFINLFNFL